MKKLSIGQMARLNGVSEQALRLYDKEGLFSPLHRDAENGYRYYDIRQSAQLDMIQRMKALGMSLKDIKKQLKHFDPDMLKDILYRNLDEIDDRSRELMYQRKAIERTLESYEWYENAPPDGTIVLEYIPRRLTYMTDSGVNFYDYGIDVYEKILRELKKNLIANQLRSRGIAADVAPTAAKLGKQIKYADKLGIPYVWFPADASEEGAQDEVKNIITGDQRPADAQSWEPDTVYAQQTVTVEA